MKCQPGEAACRFYYMILTYYLDIAVKCYSFCGKQLVQADCWFPSIQYLSIKEEIREKSISKSKR